MPRSRAYYVLIVGVILLTICEPFTSTVFVPTPADAIADVVWLFVQGAAAFCLGADVLQFSKQKGWLL